MPIACYFLSNYVARDNAATNDDEVTEEAVAALPYALPSTVNLTNAPITCSFFLTIYSFHQFPDSGTLVEPGGIEPRTVRCKP